MNNTNSAGSYSLGNTNNVVGVGSAAPKSIMDGIDMGTGTAGNTARAATAETAPGSCSPACRPGRRSTAARRPDDGPLERTKG